MPSENSASWLIRTIKRLVFGALWLVLKSWKLFSLCILGARCRFHPSCSEYAYDALKEHGFFKGSWLALKRISSCHPLYKAPK